MFEHCLYFNLTALTRVVTQRWHETLRPLGLSPSHGYLLAAMAHHPAASQKQLSQIMQLDASTITRFVDVLTRKQLIERTGTGKGSGFCFTPRGRDTARQIEELMKELYGEMESTLGPTELQTFVGQARGARQALDPTNTPPRLEGDTP